MTFIKGLPLMLLTISLGCNAAVQPDRTRIVFNANDKATSLRIENQSEPPRESWRLNFLRKR